jgi:hypothetical protein
MADGPRWVGWASFDGQKMQKPKQPKMLCFFQQTASDFEFLFEANPI